MDNFEEFISVLTKIHKERPTLRIMQSIINATGDGFSVYYIEDEAVIKKLKDTYKDIFNDKNIK